MADWYFPCAKGGTPRGLNNGEIDTFKSAPIRSLAREICQNSLDALPMEKKIQRAAGEKVEPIKVEFNVFDGKVLQRQTLLANVKKMLAYWKSRQKNDFTVVDFLKNVIGNLSKDSIPFLRISDFNTTGLCGIREPGSPWDNLVVSVGASDKPPDAGGSKGVGHAAPFACSDIQTVFYFTKNVEGDKAFGGVTRLVGWREDKINGHEEIGHFGDGEVCQDPLPDMVPIGDSFTRDSCGSDVYVAGFNQENWQDGVIQSAISSFLLAFYRNTLNLSVDGKEINSKSLAGIIEERLSQGKEFQNHADQYYRVLTSPDSKTFELENPEGIPGKFLLKLLIDPKLDVRKVALVRDTGMLILERDHISSSIRFAGVLEVQGVELNAFLRKLENGQHTEWSDERAKNSADKEKAKSLLSTIYKFCKSKLLSMNVVKPGETLDSGLGCSADSGQGADGESSEQEEELTDELKPVVGNKKQRKKKESGQKKKRRRIKVKNDDGEEDETPGDDVTPPPDHVTPPLPPSPPSPPLPPAPAPIKWADVETSELEYVCVDRANSKYQIVFTPDDGFDHAMVKLYVMAETEAYNAAVVSARLEDGTELSVSNGNEIGGFDFVKGKPLSMTVTLDYADYCSLEVEAYGHN